MSDVKPMPRGWVAIAGGLILLAALVGLYIGAAQNKGSRYSDADVADVVPTHAVANAQALTTPPVDETEVRRWAREEVQAALNHPVIKKPATPTPSDDSSTAPSDAPLAAPSQPITAPVRSAPG